MKKATIILSICLLHYTISLSQYTCGSDSIDQILLNADSAAIAKFEQLKTYWKNQPASLNKKKALCDITKIVPVVFHIIHDNGPENIPDSLIYEQIEILNEDFRKLTSTPGDGAGVDTEIEFCLATIDPDGNPTTGITRTDTPCTDLSNPGCGGTLWPGSIIFWGDSTKSYLNIWIRRNFGHLGLGGVGWMVEVRYNLIGRNGAFNGRGVTNEVGHWLSLYHTFNDGCGTDCATSGDYVCDTPPVAAPGSCPPGANTCSNDNPDTLDQVENYMDYSLNCANMFTEGQKTRMYQKIDNPSSYISYLATWQNLQNTGCDPPPTFCAPIADFSSDKKLINIGESVTFTDLSYYTPTSWEWSFPGGNPSTDTSQNPVVTYNNIGTYDVTLIATSTDGSDTIIKNNYSTTVTQQWSSLGTGMDGSDGGTVFTLEVYQNELYAGGYFDIADGDSAIKIARWDGTNWYALGAGMIDTNWWTANTAMVEALEVYNNELYVGGTFTSAGDTSAFHIARWDGSNWSAVGSGLPGSWGVYELVVFNSELYVGVYDSIMKWDGTNWSKAATTNHSILALYVYNNELYAAGQFDTINGMAARIARFDGTTWYPFVSELTPFNTSSVSAIIGYDSMLYIGGGFDSVDGVNANSIARWDGVNWNPVDSGVGGSPNIVDYLTVWNDKLIVGGWFSTAGGNIVNNIASWDGSSWMSLGSGTSGTPTGGMVRALKVWDNELYVGGSFITAGGDTVNCIVKWGCDNLGVSFIQSADTVDLAVSGNVIFTDQSVNAVNWFWDFGDGATDTVQNPAYSYWQEGTYTVTLTTTNDTCSNSAISTVVVIWNCYPLSVNFQSADTVNLAVSGDIQFTSQTSAVDSFLWDFGDGTTDTAQNPLHTYDSVGVYTVTLTGFRDTCSSAAVKTVVVIKDCSFLNANFIQSTDTVNIAVSGAVQFTDSSTNALQWNWNFGDGNTETMQNPTHSYDSVGTYTVTLIVDTGICSDTATSIIVVVNNVGVKGLQSASDHLQIYPNPNTGQFTLEMDLQEETKLNIKFYHFTGQLIYSEVIGNVIGNYTQQIDLNGYSKGVYFVQISIDNSILTRKVVLY